MMCQIKAHGLAPVLVLADEPSQWPDTTGERMVAAAAHRGGEATPIADSSRSARGRVD